MPIPHSMPAGAASHTAELAALDVFAGCAPADLSALARHLQPLRAAPGEVLMRQGDAARKAVAYGGEPLDLVLTEFSSWIAQTCRREDVRPWGNGASFDLTIVGSAYKRLGLQTPWHFTNERCFRTIRNQHPTVEYDTDEKGTGAHNVLIDAVFQAKHLFAIKNRNKGATSA